MAGDNPEGVGENQPQINSYRVPKIPPFWKVDPTSWFALVDASFRVANITVDRTKVDSLVATFDHEVISHVLSLITQDPPPDDLYRLFKERILSAFSSSPEVRLRQLLKGQLNGDLKPSHLLNQMKTLNGGQCNDAVLKSLFIEQLPEAHKAIIVALNETDLQKLAEVADKLADLHSTSVYASPVGHSPRYSKQSTDSSPVRRTDLESQMEQLIKQVSLLSSEVTKLKRARSSSRPRGRSGDRKEKGNTSGLCHIHAKYGKDAKFCRKPCTWGSNQGN